MAKFEKGHKKIPGSGRQKGQVAATTSVAALCVQMGVDPMKIMLDLCRTGDESMQFAAAKEIVQYIYAKRKAIEVSLKDIETEELAAEVEARINGSSD